MKKEKTNRKESFSVIREKIITFTAEAAEKIKGALERHSASGVRIVARQNENGTLSYRLGLEDRSCWDDLVVDEKGIKLFLDSTSAKLVQGLEIRYVKTERASGFAFVNPGG